MGTKLKRFNIGKKMYLFVFATVLFTVASVSIISYRILSNQIDTYYKRLTINSAEFYSSVFDGDYLAELRDVIMSDEYQALRDHAEEIDDDSLVIEYLDERGLWDQYQVEREKLLSYVEDMDDIEYLYLIVWSEDPAEDGLYYDMYLVDADDLPFYQAGYWEEREPEFEGVMPEDTIDPVISNGDWGWLCSAYKAIYDSNGNIVCHLGCDVTMDQIMAERSATLISIIASAVLCAVIALIGAFVFVNKTIVRPLKSLTSGMKNFSPAVGKDYDQSGVIDLDIRSSDEIRDVYEETRSMQMRLVDYIRDITTIR